MTRPLVAASRDLIYVTLPGRQSADPFAGGAAAREAGVSMRVVTLTHDPDRRPHLHPHSAEVMYVVRGQGSLWVEGARQPVREGDCVFVPAGSAHATIPDPGSDMELVCFFPHPDLSANTVELERELD